MGKMLDFNGRICDHKIENNTSLGNAALACKRCNSTCIYNDHNISYIEVLCSETARKTKFIVFCHAKQ